MEEQIDAFLSMYVFTYYGHLMTEQEWRAYRHLAGTSKATHGRSDAVAQEEAKGSTSYFRRLLSDDPSVRCLTRDGLEEFVLRTGLRILSDHPDQILLNRCPRCNALARTPRAQQCRLCGHDWHNEAVRSQRP